MNSTVVITGASSGIGRATALEFARKGASLVLASRREDALREVAAECEELGARAIAVATDVTDNQQVKALAATAVAEFGSVEVWVNDASVSVYGPLLDIPLKDFRRVLDVNILGYVYGTRAALRLFQKQGRGTIVNVASILGEVPQPYSAPYSMSKAAVRALGATVRQELGLAGQRAISVSTILPPTIDTPFFRHAANYSGREVRAMPPVYPPQLVARTIVRAAARPKAEIVVGAAGKLLVREHRRHPRTVQTQVALQTNLGQLSPTQSAANTTGNLYETPPTDDASVTGGWDGAKRLTVRKTAAAAVLAGATALAATRLLRR